MDDLPAQFLRGVALFNDGRFFECHEALEEVWLKSAGGERAFLHALIQAAAALHHFRQGNDKGARSVYERARRKLENGPAIVMKLDVRAFTRELEEFFRANVASASDQAPFPQIELQDRQ
jgi:predicted metal-dependent hydrolase